MQPLGKALKTAKIDNRPWQQELSRFLLQYRTTPHCSTGVSPAELLFNRTVQGKLPILWKNNVLDKHQQARDNERKRKEYNEGYAHRKQRTKKSDIQVGDCVLVKQERNNKLTPNYNPTPYVVIRREHSRVTAKSKDGHTITRNVSHFKRIPEQELSEDEEENRPDRREPDETQGQPTNVNDNVQHEHDSHPVRRSTRETKRPERYGQPVLWGL